MAKKRRSAPAKAAGPRELNPEDAKIAAFNTWEDIPDEEDEFHISRDKVMLESENVGNRRKNAYEESDEEVLALDEYDEDDAEGSEGSEASEASEGESEEEEEAPRAKGKGSKKQQIEEDDSDAAQTDSEDPDAEGWGTSKKDYYGGDTIQTEEDAALEAAEALRLQAKQAAAIREADYGFDDATWGAEPSETTKKDDPIVGQSLVVTETLPTEVPEGLTPEERTKILEARHPEFKLLAEVFSELQALHAPLGLSASAAEAVGETVRSSVAVVKFRALSTYLGVLSMYFAVLSSPETVQSQGTRLREHGVMDGLLKCRKMWEAVKGLEVEEIRSDGVELKKKKNSVTAKAAAEKKQKEEPKRKRAKLSPAFSDSDLESTPVVKSSKKSKKTATSDLSDLTALATSFRPTPTATTASKPKKTPTTATNDTTDFGDDTALSALDAEQKAVRRRNLRFYTSQIVSKSAKRDAAGQSAGGDTDIPHRERRKEKELRLAAEAARRRNDGADLGDSDIDEEDKKVARQMREEDSDNEYYDMLAGKVRAKKEQKKAWHEAERVGGEVRVVEEETEGGKRAVGYVIEKNKGLTPHRKKDVRNPRVKKRKKYEAAKKKIGSKKAVYKGGLQGSYGGELTGIKKNLVKSIKFK